MRTPGPIRILVIDASPLQCRVLGSELSKRPEFTVVGRVYDTVSARDAILQHHPELIVLGAGSAADLRLIRALRTHYPVPLLVCGDPGSLPGHVALRALARGALELVPPPPKMDGPHRRRWAEDISRRIQEAVGHAKPVPVARTAASWLPPRFANTGRDPARHLVAIGASTGGTEAIRALLAHAPPDFPPTVIVQHMPPVFTRSFAERLDHFSPLSVAEAVDGEALKPGLVRIARGDTHITVAGAPGAWRLAYTHQEPVNRHCPSADVLFDSVAECAGRYAIGILLTGMGNDGALGLLRMRRAGALTVAQDCRSCVVYGMPKVATELGAVLFSAPPEEIPGVIHKQLQCREARVPPVVS